MSQEIRLKELERKIYTSFHQDGLIDIIIGLCTLGFGLNLLTDSSGWSIFSWMPILFYQPLKTRITIPRLGFVKFDPHRSAIAKTLKGFLLIGLLIGMIILLFLVLVKNSLSPEIRLLIQEYFILILGGFAASVLGIVGLISGMYRFLGYAVTASIIFPFTYWFSLPDSLPVLILGSIVLVFGGTTLTLFLRNYHLADKVDHNVK